MSRKTAAQRQADYRARHPDRVKASKIAGNERDRAWRKVNQERINELGRIRHARLKEELNARRKEIKAKNPERQKRWTRKSYEKNREARLANGKAWRAANPEKCLEMARDWKVKNREAYLARSTELESIRRAVSKNATPVWANKFFMREAYDLARRRTKCMSGGVKWSVDHIVPLQSKIVCGLHVENNLAVIPRADNIRKGNKVWPCMPERI